MSDPITQTESFEWQLRICRPAFQDFQLSFPRYYDRSELNRQLQKLQWWNSDQRLVIDLLWNVIPNTELAELFIELGGKATGSVRILFFEHSPDPAVLTLWILGGMSADEEFDNRHHEIYLGRSTIVKARAD